VTIDVAAIDAEGSPWAFDVAGAFTSRQGGMLRSDVVWRSLGRAHALRGVAPHVPLVLLTSHLPRRSSEGDTALRAAGPLAFFDAVELLDDDGVERLRRYAKGGFTDNPQPGFWTTTELARRRSPPS
jgi:hypothetical protein